MKQVKLILESLKDLDKNSADSLYKKMIKSNDFKFEPKLGKETMFIFPDGKMLAGVVHSRYSYPTREPERDAYHNDMYDYIDDSRIPINTSKVFQRGFKHIGFNEELAKYYNLVFVAPGHSSGFIIIPKGVEPTAEQQAILDVAAKSGGWEIENENEDTSQETI